jgi:serine/threonine protein kinase
VFEIHTARGGTMLTDSRLSELLNRWQDLSEQGRDMSAEDLCADCPGLAAELGRLIEALKAIGTVIRPGESQDTSPRFMASTTEGEASFASGTPVPNFAGSRYSPLHFHAKGNLGEVYVARDEELQRRVALKVIQQKNANDLASLRRFKLEAEVTGRLEHPGVIPVYGQGDYGDGRPCYAMRFISPGTLLDSLKEFHEVDGVPGRDQSKQRLRFRKLIGHFISVCHTVAYAHSRGVLHRDLKPANILLGKYGETLIIDWGLAKPFERGEAERTCGEETLDPSSPSDTTDVLTRGLIGTPAYMSPEQAEVERSDSVGPASDIYSLGATLYVIVTGRPPVTGQSIGEVLDKVRRGDFLPPSRVKEIPQALEEICLKAMARLPEDRYSSASALAADLERWLADEPILAYYTAVSHYEDLAKRYPKVRRYREGLGRSQTDLGNVLHVLGRNTEAEATHRAAIREYQALVNDWPLVLDYQEGLASNYTKLGQVLTSMDQEHEAQQAHRAALAEYRSLLLADRGIDYESKLKNSIELLNRTGGGDDSPMSPPRRWPVEARRWLSRYRKLMAAGVAVIIMIAAVGVLQRMGARYENVIVQNEIDLAQTHLSLGTLYMQRAGGRPDAIKSFEQAAKNWESLARKNPTNPRYRAYAAAVRDYLGSIPPPTP